MVPDFVRLGFTAATPLPNQGFPARFPARKQGYKSAATSHIAAVIINDPPDTLRPYLDRSKATPDQIAIALNNPQPEE